MPATPQNSITYVHIDGVVVFLVGVGRFINIEGVFRLFLGRVKVVFRRFLGWF